MNGANKDVILNEIPLFADLSLRQRHLIRARAEFREYKKGELIYTEGSAADAFYCIISGRVVIYTKDSFGDKTILEYLHRGKYFGIISLLTSEPHSVTAEAINDCSLLILKKEDFNFILKKIPRLAVDLSMTLSRRLKRKDIHRKSIFESTIISAFSSYSQAGKTIYALNLALSLAKETHKSVVILDIASRDKIHSLPNRLGIKEMRVFDLAGSSPENPSKVQNYIIKNISGIDLACFHYDSNDASCLKRFMEILSLLVNDYHYLVLDLPSLMDRSVFNILNQSDIIHILSSPEQVDLKSTHELIEKLISEFNFRKEKIKVIINEYKASNLSHQEQADILTQNVFATLPKIDFQASDKLIAVDPECEYSKAIRRIARQLGDCSVGLVLGVGAGYGFCHIGVLKVIEEENIPIDVISGASIGAVIAGMWAVGMRSNEILEATKEFAEPKHLWGLIDLTFSLSGFIKGNKLRSFLKKHLGDKTFYDVRLPLKIIASDVKRKEPRVFDKGSLVDAIMASCSMPGIFTPFKVKEEMLFDGGITNPLPTEALFKTGIKKIIAVNVTPSREDIMRQYERIKREITVAIPEDIKKKRWLSLKERIKDSLKTNIVDIIFSSVEVLQSEVAQKEAQLADVVLHPDTSGLFWLELHKAALFAKRGEEEARRNLDKIWQLVND